MAKDKKNSHRLCNMVKKSEALKICAKVNKKTGKKEHYWVDNYTCPKCKGTLQRNRNAFGRSTAVCDGTPHGQTKTMKKPAKKKEAVTA